MLFVGLIDVPSGMKFGCVLKHPLRRNYQKCYAVTPGTRVIEPHWKLATA